MTDLDRMRSEEPLPMVDPLADQQPSSRVPWLALALLVLAVAAAGWWWAPWSQQSPAESVGRVALEPAPARSEVGPRLGAGAADPDLPSLAAMDAYLRPLLAGLSARPELAALLASDDLVRRFVVSVETVARGASPAAQVRQVAPRASFATRGDGAALQIDPASYSRYDGLVTMVEDLDPEQLAQLYGRLEPRLEEAHGELGVKGSFDQTMERALGHLLSTPSLPAQPHVKVGKGTAYVYADPTLEALSPAQRQLLRLGPERAARVQARLRAFARALGISEDRLRG